MKLYNFTPAANALRVEMFLNEKSINLETIQVNVREDELFKEPYKSMNPFNCVPFLELEDGTIITETISICRYIEEKHPDPVLFGPVSTPLLQPTTTTSKKNMDQSTILLVHTMNCSNVFSASACAAALTSSSVMFAARTSTTIKTMGFAFSCFKYSYSNSGSTQ